MTQARISRRDGFESAPLADSGIPYGKVGAGYPHGGAGSNFLSSGSTSEANRRMLASASS